MTNTNNTTNAAKPSTNSMQWGTEQIFEAHFMYPTPHFDSIESLQSISDCDFSNMMISIVETLGDLSEQERGSLKLAVLSGNRLRVYYLILKLFERHVIITSDTQQNKELKNTENALTKRGFQVGDADTLVGVV